MKPRLNYAKVAPGGYVAKELADLTLAVAAINAWNRLSIAARLEPGRYQAPATGGLASAQA